jgi:hypothetical protein
MHQTRLLEAIKAGLDGPEAAAAEVRAAARELEGSTGVGEVLAALVDPGFPDAVLAAARRPGQPQRAWLTLAAVGARRARQILAWRASELVDADLLASLAPLRRGPRERGFRHAIAAAADPTQAAALSLLAGLRGGELRAMMRARPALAAARRRVRAAGPPTPLPVLG